MKKLGFGFMRLPQTDAADTKSIDLPQVVRMVDHFLAHGFRYFDTAYPYHAGVSEEAIRQTLVERYPRDAFELADKMPVWMVKTGADYARIFAEQLSRCGVDYFDNYMLHALDAERYPECVERGGFAFLQTLKERGQARRVGFSYHDKVALLERILSEQTVDFVQLQINYLDWDDAGVQARECYEVATAHGVPVIVMEPLKGGTLANVPAQVRGLFAAHNADSPAAWALRYAASLENACMVLSGMNDFAQLTENVQIMQSLTPLDARAHAVVQTAVESLHAANVIPCTACKYCVNECPAKILIPNMLRLYNDQHVFGLLPRFTNHYKFLTESAGKASACVACRQCEAHCPQHIAIAHWMGEVAGVFG
ncbi:MAG: aldo/keto reductase [Oscillospiraceae bacterium]|jgi:predicted aldo/keto reductase-like oxidoreductase|nr:aldo/keto reductase [Oscillospiraceae bacterium]